MDILALLISIIALVSTLRKKEFGKFFLIQKNDPNKDVWVKVIKSDIYEVKFICEPYKGMKCRIDRLEENSKAELAPVFIKEANPTYEFGILKSNTIVKFHNCNSTMIHVTFRDKFNNLYSQHISRNKASRRNHKNILNLTFTGS